MYAALERQSTLRRDVVLDRSDPVGADQAFRYVMRGNIAFSSVVSGELAPDSDAFLTGAYTHTLSGYGWAEPVCSVAPGRFACRFTGGSYPFTMGTVKLFLDALAGQPTGRGRAELCAGVGVSPIVGESSDPDPSNDNDCDEVAILVRPLPTLGIPIGRALLPWAGLPATAGVGSLSRGAPHEPPRAWFRATLPGSPPLDGTGGRYYTPL